MSETVTVDHFIRPREAAVAVCRERGGSYNETHNMAEVGSKEGDAR